MIVEFILWSKKNGLLGQLKYFADKFSILLAATQRIDSDIIFHYLPFKSKIIS